MAALTPFSITSPNGNPVEEGSKLTINLALAPFQIYGNKDEFYAQRPLQEGDVIRVRADRSEAEDFVSIDGVSGRYPYWDLTLNSDLQATREIQLATDDDIGIEGMEFGLRSPINEGDPNAPIGDWVYEVDGGGANAIYPGWTEDSPYIQVIDQVAPVEPPVFHITQDSSSADEETVAPWFTITGENLVEGEQYTFNTNGIEIKLTSNNPVYLEGAGFPSFNVDGDKTIPLSISRGSTTDTFTVIDIDGTELAPGGTSVFDFTIIDADGSGDPAPAPSPEPSPSPDPSPSPAPSDVVDLSGLTPEPTVEPGVVDLSDLDLTGIEFEPIWNVPANRQTSGVDQFELTEMPDFIEAGRGRTRGTADDDFIAGSRKDDFLIGRSGDDFLRAGRGDDRIKAGAGNDFILDGNGDDLIIDGSGDDFIVLGNGEDVVKLGSGDNILVGYDSSEDVLKAQGGIEWATTDQGLFGTYDNGTVALF